ncbi:hypothetical protein B0H19DRAFT_1239003 [Mycena capillaripes]|nr:hypothetical protein B0H19DRAFT_1239003 [Mycena capillaripes]
MSKSPLSSHKSSEIDVLHTKTHQLQLRNQDLEMKLSYAEQDAAWTAKHQQERDVVAARELTQLNSHLALAQEISTEVRAENKELKSKVMQAQQEIQFEERFR